MLHQDAVHAEIVRQPLDRGDGLKGRRGGRKLYEARVDAGLLAPVALHLDVGDRRRIVPDQHRRQTRAPARLLQEPPGPAGDVGQQLLRDGGAVISWVVTCDNEPPRVDA